MSFKLPDRIQIVDELHGVNEINPANRHIVNSQSNQILHPHKKLGRQQQCLFVVSDLTSGVGVEVDISIRSIIFESCVVTFHLLQPFSGCSLVVVVV